MRWRRPVGVGAVKGLYLMPTCQNPTLAQIPEYRRRKLVEICRRYDIMIIEDDVYALSLEHGCRPLPEWPLSAVALSPLQVKP